MRSVAASLPADVYEATDFRLNSVGLNNYFQGGGVLTGEVPPQTAFPYLVMDPLGENVLALTNFSDYYKLVIQLSVYDKSFQTSRKGLELVRVAMTCAPLILATGEVLAVLPGDRHFMAEGRAWRALEGFRVLRAESLNRFPS